MRRLRISEIFILSLPIIGGIMQNLISSWLYEARLLSVVVSIVFFVVFVLGTVFLWRRAEVLAILRSSKTLLGLSDRKRHGREGLVVFVTLYRPNQSNATAGTTAAEWLEKAARLDYQALDFPNSNFKQPIEALRTHAASLKACWLISTVGKDGENDGSRPYVPVFIQYLREELGLRNVRFYHEDHVVSLTVDTEVVPKVKELIETIFSDVRKKGAAVRLTPRQMVTDVTGGTVSMKLGAFLACMDTDRDVQMIGTHYTQAGDPTGELFPMIVGFEPDVSRIEY